MTRAFHRWSTAAVVTLEDSSHFMVLEQFKNSVPERVVKVKSPSEAAVLADEKHMFIIKVNTLQRPQLKVGTGGSKGPVNVNTCRYSLLEGHWKKKIVQLDLKSQDNLSQL